MADEVKQAWEEVGQRFSALGRTMKEHYKGATGRSDDDDADASAVKEALERLRVAVAELADRTGDLVHDERLRGETKEVVGSLEKALGATADQITQAVEGLVRRKGKDEGGQDDRPPTA